MSRMIIVAIMTNRIALALVVAAFTALPPFADAQVKPVTQLPAPPDVAAPPADAAKTATGLASKVIKPGSGDVKPKTTDLVTVHYTGWTTDGKMFDSSHARNKPSSFPLGNVIAGWRECVSLMTVGE